MSKKNYLIAPSILSADFRKLGEQVRLVEQAGGDWVHVDIMDGHFVPTMSMGPLALAACRKVTQLPLDVHLMVKEPEKFIKIFAEAGADHLTVHAEATPNLHRLLQAIQDLGCQPGVVINPGTPASILTPVLHMVHLVLVMTVNPGYGGQKFIPETLPKIRAIRTQLDEINPQARIQVDGGIAAETIQTAATAGACVFVAGSAVFNHPDGIQQGIQALRAALN